MKKILIIAPHPDDEVLGAGGTIAKLVSQGHDVFAVLLCESSSPRYSMEMVDVLQNKALQAGKILGIKDIFFYNFTNVQTNCIPMADMLQALSECLKRVKPQVIFTHHRADVHIDHQMVFKATLAAARSFDGSKIEQILCYEVPSSTEWAPPFPDHTFLPNVFYDISDTIGEKTKAMSIYKSEMREFPHPRSIKALYTYARRWGIKAGIHGYVEPFELIRDIR